MTQQGRNLFAEETQQQPAQQPQQQGRNLFAEQQRQPPEEPGMLKRMGEQLWQAVTGGDRQTEESLRSPELITAPAADVGAALGFNLALNFDPLEIESVIKENLPLATFRSDKKGNKYVDIGGKEYIINRPGMSKQDVGATLGNIMANIPAAKLASLGKSVLGRLTLGGGAAAGTQAGIEGVQAATGGEFTGSEVGIAGALGAAGEIPAAIRAARMSDEARGMVPRITDAQAEFARNVRETTGVELMPNQVTGNEYDNLVALAVRRDPEAGQQFTNRLKKQSSDVYAGVSNLLNDLATSGQSEQAARAVKETSLEAVEQARQARSRVTRPLYNKAFSSAAERGQVIDVSDVARNIDSEIDEATGPIKDAYLKMQSLAQEAAQPSASGSNVQRLHNLKRALFAERDKLKREGVLTNELGRAYENTFRQVRDKLVDKVPEYEAANTTFRNLSPEVDELSEGIIGNLADVSDDKLKQISNLIFDWRETNANPQAIRNAKRVIQDVNPDAWNALVRNKLERDLGEIGIETAEEAGDTTINFLQKLYSKTFSGKDKAMVMSALDGEQKANFNALSEAIERGRNRPGQSATAQLQDIEAKLTGASGATGFVSALMSGTRELVNKALNIQTNRDQNIKALSKIILDPEWMDRMSEIRKTGLRTKQGGAAFAQLFRDAVREEEGEE